MSVTRIIVIAALSMFCLHGSASAEPSPGSPNKPQIATAVVRLAGEIDDYRRDTLFRHFREAEAAGAKTIIVEIDTLGGMVTSGLDISRSLRGQTHVHTIAYIDPKAYSAGALIAVACDEIVMAPSSVIGDCAPIMLDSSGSLQPLPPTERAKILSPLLQDFEESCARNGYNRVLAEAMVKVDAPIYLIADAKGNEKVVGAEDYKKLTESGGWKSAEGVSNPVNPPDRLLTVGPALAKRLGLCKETAASVQELADARGYKIVADLTPGAGEHVVEMLNSHGARFVLLIIFFLSLYICLHAPGHGAAEAVSIVSLGLLVAVPLLTGYAQWWELAMIVIGLSLCAFELLVFPGHGVSLVVGVIMVLFGLLLTFAGKDINPGWLPNSQMSWHRLRGGLKVMVGASVTAIIVGSFIRPFLPKLPIFRRLMLTEISGKAVRSAGTPLKAGEDVWPFVGTIGVAKTDLRPGGVVDFPYGDDHRSADVYGVSGYIAAGAKVVVQEARGNRIVVRAI